MIRTKIEQRKLNPGKSMELLVVDVLFLSAEINVTSISSFPFPSSSFFTLLNFLWEFHSIHPQKGHTFTPLIPMILSGWKPNQTSQNTLSSFTSTPVRREREKRLKLKLHVNARGKRVWDAPLNAAWGWPRLDPSCCHPKASKSAFSV